MSWLEKMLPMISIFLNLPSSPFGSACGQSWRAFHVRTFHVQLRRVPISAFGWNALLLLFSCSVMSDTLWPCNCSTPGLPVLYCLPEFAQIHFHWVDNAIKPSHPLLPPSPTLNLSQYQGIFSVSQLFTSGGQSIGASASASVFLMNI